MKMSQNRGAAYFVKLKFVNKRNSSQRLLCSSDRVMSSKARQVAEPFTKPFRRGSKIVCNGDLTLAINPPMRSIAPFDISDLECEALLKLFREATFHIQDIRIELVTDGRRHPEQEAHPAATLGLAVQKPTIRFARSC
jgi:hypothetical protein